MATMTDASDQLGVGCYQQDNSDLVKPWRPVATFRGHEAFPTLSLPPPCATLSSLGTDCLPLKEMSTNKLLSKLLKSPLMMVFKLVRF